MAGFLSEVAVLVRLKFTILRHTSAGLKLSRVIFWPLAVVATWGAVLAAGGGADGPRHDVLLLSLAGWGVGWLIGPILASGTGVLRPEFFALLPVDRRRIGLALLAVSCVGYGPAVTVLSLGALGAHAVGLAQGAAGALAVAVPGVVLLFVFVVALSRVAYALLGAAMGSRLGVAMSAIQYGAFIAALFTGWLAISATRDGTAALIRDGLPGQTAARVLEVFPTSWPVLATEAAAQGRWPVALGWLLALAAATAVLAVLCAHLLTPKTANRTPRRRFRSLGTGVLTSRPLLPGTPLGAVVGKELRQWWRDPWRSLEVQCGVWTGVFIGLIGLISGVPEILPFAGVVVALMAALVACNLLGQDGTAVWQTVVGAGPHTVRDDIRGRQLALLLLFGPAALLLTVVFTLISDQGWAWPLLLSLLPALLGTALGVAVLLSVVAATPGVDPKYRVGPNDAGDVSFQVHIGLYGTLLPVLPTAALAVFGVTSGQPWLAWLAVPAGVLNGWLVAWLLGRVAYRRLAARLPETFVRLRYGKTIAAQQQPSGDHWLDKLERGAIKGNQERKPVGT